MDTLRNAVAVIAGAGSGRGRATARSLARRGAHILVADIDAPAAQTVTEELAAYGTGALAVRCDVASGTSFDELTASALDRFGRVGINLMSVVRSNAVFLPYLLEQGRGHVTAVVRISEGLRGYLQPQGNGVTVLCPGPVKTSIAASPGPGSGPAVATRGPGEQFAVLDADTVGEQVAEAVVASTFMVCTHEHVRDVLVERASDRNAFNERQTAAMTDR